MIYFVVGSMCWAIAGPVRSYGTVTPAISTSEEGSQGFRAATAHMFAQMAASCKVGQAPHCNMARQVREWLWLRAGITAAGVTTEDRQKRDSTACSPS